MDHVVYVLGAGFSAPLGLPVVANFRVKSQDQFFADQERFAHFENVFASIRRMAEAKNYFSSDLYDIEEILSIIEMERLVGLGTRDDFINYIRDVINYHTPPILPSLNGGRSALGIDPASHENRFQSQWPPYISFVMTVCGLHLVEAPAGCVGYLVRDEQPNVKYSILSLNYDTVLERAVDHLTRSHCDGQSLFQRSTSVGNRVGFDQFPPIASRPLGSTLLAKLHGTVEDPASIVPPTWSKGAHSQIEAAWTKAHEALTTATHIRFVGYSLPEGDAYIRFLLKSAVRSATNLKAIDVTCLDPDAEVEKRYRWFCHFRYFRFSAIATERYLQTILNATIQGWNDRSTPVATHLERAHNELLSNPVR